MWTQMFERVKNWEDNLCSVWLLKIRKHSMCCRYDLIGYVPFSLPSLNKVRNEVATIHSELWHGVIC